MRENGDIARPEGHREPELQVELFVKGVFGVANRQDCIF